MPKYLAVASYTSEGIKGLTRAGGSSRRAVVDKLLRSLGGHLEAFYFAFGENDAYLILDVPDNLTAAAISLAVAGAGATRMKTIELLTPEEIDRAMQKHVDYTPPGQVSRGRLASRAPKPADEQFTFRRSIQDYGPRGCDCTLEGGLVCSKQSITI